jgi:hypothetical protein
MATNISREEAGRPVNEEEEVLEYKKVNYKDFITKPKYIRSSTHCSALMLLRSLADRNKNSMVDFGDRYRGVGYHNNNTT